MPIKDSPRAANVDFGAVPIWTRGRFFREDRIYARYFNSLGRLKMYAYAPVRLLFFFEEKTFVAGSYTWPHMLARSRNDNVVSRHRCS